ncbi:hypothetical protein ACG7TL_004716 [Trametes sanguinea]
MPSLYLSNGRGGLLFALAIRFLRLLTLGALSRELCLHLSKGLAVERVGPRDLRIDLLALHAGREPDGLAHQACGLICHLLRGLATPDDVLRMLVKGGEKGKTRHTSCARTRRAKSEYSSSPAMLPPGADANSALTSSRAAARSCAGVAAFLPFAGADLAVVEADMAGSGGVPLFADSGTIAANDVARQRSVVSALRTRAAITKRANTATTHDRTARPGERSRKRISLGLHLLRGLLQIAANLSLLHLLWWLEARKLFLVFAEGFLQSHGKRGKFAFDFAFERSHRAAEIFGASERGDVAGPGAAEDAYRRVHGFADFALRTEEAVPLDDQEGLIKGLTAKDHLDARRDRQKLAVASIIRQDQDGQLLKHLRARERRDFVANFDGATVKILQSRLHGEQGDAKNVSTLSQPRGRALIPPRYRARSHRWLNGDVQDLSEGEMMRPTNRHQRFSHTALSGYPGARKAVPSRGALAERGIDLRSVERRARKRSRALRAVAACSRAVSVRPAKLAKPAKILSEVFPLSLSLPCEAKGGQPSRRLIEDAPRHRAPDTNLPHLLPSASFVPRVGLTHQRHRFPLHILCHVFDIDPAVTETVTPARRSPRVASNLRICIAASPEEARRAIEANTDGIHVFSDGSLLPGHGVGGAAVLERDGIIVESLRCHLGPARYYTIFDGENVGLYLALELVLRARRVRRVSIFVDSQSVITALDTPSARPGHHLTDRVLLQFRRLQRRHPRARVTVHWVPSHTGIPGNEAVDCEAKRAAHGKSSPLATLPCSLRKPIPRSASAIRQYIATCLRNDAKHVWSSSPRHANPAKIGPPLPSRKYLQLTAALPRRSVSLLTQLRTGHAPLGLHLHRIGKADSPVCPSCRSAPETVAHFLLQCPSHRRHRAPLARACPGANLSLKHLLASTVVHDQLLTYVRATGRMPHLVAPAA